MSQARGKINEQKFAEWCDVDKHGLQYYLPFLNLKKRVFLKKTVGAAVFGNHDVLKGDREDKTKGNYSVKLAYYAFESKIVELLIEAGELTDPNAPGVQNTSENSSDESLKPPKQNKPSQNEAQMARRIAQLEKENFDLQMEVKRLEGAQRHNKRHRETIAVLNEINGVL